MLAENALLRQQLIILGETHLHNLLSEYVGAYFNVARSHQGLGQQIPSTVGTPTERRGSTGKIFARPVLGGLRHDYRRAA